MKIKYLFKKIDVKQAALGDVMINKYKSGKGVISVSLIDKEAMEKINNLSLDYGQLASNMRSPIDNLLVLRTNDSSKCLNEFLFHSLKRGDLPASFKHTNFQVEELLNRDIDVPDLAKQQSIVTTLDAFEKSSVLLEELLEKKIKLTKLYNNIVMTKILSGELTPKNGLESILNIIKADENAEKVMSYEIHKNHTSSSAKDTNQPKLN